MKGLILHIRVGDNFTHHVNALKSNLFTVLLPRTKHINMLEFNIDKYNTCIPIFKLLYSLIQGVWNNITNSEKNTEYQAKGYCICDIELRKHKNVSIN